MRMSTLKNTMKMAEITVMGVILHGVTITAGTMKMTNILVTASMMRMANTLTTSSTTMNNTAEYKEGQSSVEHQ